jgi:hypothetical protein
VALCSGVKRPDHEADYLRTSSAEVKIGGAIPPLAHLLSRCGVKLFSTGTILSLFLYTYIYKVILSYCRGFHGL